MTTGPGRLLTSSWRWRSAWLILALLPRAAGAQAVEVVLRDDSTRSLVPGAIVRLLHDGRPVASALTDERGRVLLRAPRSGSYRLRVDRIGFVGFLSDPLMLRVGAALRRELALPSVRVSLPTIQVEGSSTCQAQQQGGSLAGLLWDEIRTALTANLLTQQRAVRLITTRFVRDVNPDGTIRGERVVDWRVMSGQPFVSIAPAELARRGFVYLVDDSLEYAAPDAQLMLSDEFVATHCFRAVEGSAGLVGLAFEPASGRTLADIRGTLWVERRSNQLRVLEFAYTGLGSPDAKEAGGRIEFRQLPNGAWIVSQWYIRMPRIERRAREGGNRVVGAIGVVSPGPRLVGYSDRGGRAEVADAAMGTPVAGSAAAIKGTVYDSLTRGPLGGASVRVLGEKDSAITSSNGAFRLEISAPGQRFVEVRHRRLGLVRDSSNRAVVVPLGGEAVIEIAVPPITRFVQALCGDQIGSAVVVGLAMGPQGNPEEGLTIRADWPVVAGRGTVGVGSAVSRSGSRGLYALCRLPSNRTLTVHSYFREQPITEATVRLEAGELRWLELQAPIRPRP